MQQIPARKWLLQPSGFTFIDQLFNSPAFIPKAKELFFLKGVGESFQHHYVNSKEFREVMNQHSYFNPPQTIEELENMPWMFVSNFKEYELLSVDKSEISFILTSSGTKGKKTQLQLDAISLNRLEYAVFQVYKDLAIVNYENLPCNYLLFTYDIQQAPNLGTAWTDVLIADMNPCYERVFLINKKGNDFSFDLEFAISEYLRLSQQNIPLRILGFPAFIYETLLEIEKRKLPALKNAADSWMLTGGGWKNKQGNSISKTEFAKWVESVIHLPQENIRDCFGMAEHGIGYVDCEYGRLHVPNYAHAITRDPFTLKKTKPGEPGILQLITPLLRSYPSLSLLTTDEAILHHSPCRCGRSGDGLEIVGRLGLQHYEGCALRAMEYLK